MVYQDVDRPEPRCEWLGVSCPQSRGGLGSRIRDLPKWWSEVRNHSGFCMFREVEVICPDFGGSRIFSRKSGHF